METQMKNSDGQLFPTKASVIIFWSYITLFVNQGLLTKAVQLGQIPGFNNAIVILLTELVKLCICVGVYLFRSQSGGIAALFYDIKTNQRLLLLYLIPALLYCLYNNLTFVNLENFDVSTYYCLMQFRVVLTAIIYQILFKRQLNLIQWTSLLILTTGCLIKHIGISRNDLSSTGQDSSTARPRLTTPTYNQSDAVVDGEENLKMTSETPNQGPPLKFLWSTGLILLQMFCSCFAGVYNEYLLKDSATAKNADVILQNMFMYLDSILCNIIVYGLSSRPIELAANDIGLITVVYNLLSSQLVIVLILNNAFAGLVASFFLSSLNSILKTFASALEIFAATFLAWILFHDNIDAHTIIALVLISVATVIYSKNPVSVAPPSDIARVQNRDGFVLLPIDENHV